MNPELIAQEVLYQSGGALMLFFDFDGTLAPIVDIPDGASMLPKTRKQLQTLARRWPVAVISGRDLQDLKQRVGLSQIAYSGSHGFEIETAQGTRYQNEQLAKFLPLLDSVSKELSIRVTQMAGVSLERKAFSLALHYRRVIGLSTVDYLEDVIDEVLTRYPQLQKTLGKKVFDIQPRYAWDKGCAVRWLMEHRKRVEKTHLALYIGDDFTDEAAFQAVQSVGGIGIFVRDKDRELHESCAAYQLEGVDAVRVFFDALIGF